MIIINFIFLIIFSITDIFLNCLTKIPIFNFTFGYCLWLNIYSKELINFKIFFINLITFLTIFTISYIDIKLSLFFIFINIFSNYLNKLFIKNELKEFIIWLIGYSLIQSFIIGFNKYNIFFNLLIGIITNLSLKKEKI